MHGIIVGRYLIGHPSCTFNAGMGDDGEPSGTAGKPILNVLNHKGVGDVMIIVVSYFGGTCEHYI